MSVTNFFVVSITVEPSWKRSASKSNPDIKITFYESQIKISSTDIFLYIIILIEKLNSKFPTGSIKGGPAVVELFQKN